MTMTTSSPCKRTNPYLEAHRYWAIKRNARFAHMQHFV
jgi:hypothetical protein